MTMYAHVARLHSWHAALRAPLFGLIWRSLMLKLLKTVPNFDTGKMFAFLHCSPLRWVTTELTLLVKRFYGLLHSRLQFFWVDMG